MKRGKREFHSHNSFSDHCSKRRTRQSYIHTTRNDLRGLIASDTFYRADVQSLQNTPSLSELKRKRETEADWPWDKAPPGCESLSVAALKLFGAVSPTSDCMSKQLPEELTQLRRPRPLNPENSWIYRKVGNKVYSSIVDAVRATNDSNRRPLNLPSFEGLFTSSNAALIHNVTSVDEIISKYGPISQSEKIDNSTFVVIFQKKSILQNPDHYLNESRDMRPIVEIINAISPKCSDDRAIEAIRSLCNELEQPVRRIWVKKPSEAFPYTLTRVFVEPENTDQTFNLAKELGEKFIEGMPLVTTTNSCIDLQ